MTAGQLQASVGLSRQPLAILPTECMDTVGRSVGTVDPCHWQTDRAVLRVPHVADSVARTCASVCVCVCVCGGESIRFLTLAKLEYHLIYVPKN